MPVMNQSSRILMLLDQMPQLAWSTSTEGEIVYSNRRCIDYTGIDISQKNTNGWAKSIHPEELDLVQAEWSKAFQNGHEFQCEYRLRSHEGDFRWFLGRVVPLRDSNGQINEWLGSATDIHDLKLAQEELNRERAQGEFEREQLKMALTTAELGTCICDWSTETVVGDAQHSKIFGFEPMPRSMTFKEVEACIDPEGLEQSFESFFQAVREKRNTYQSEWKIRLPLTHELRYLRSLVRLEYNSKGEVARSFGVVSDITAQKTAQNKLLMARRSADFANQAKSQFLANMSHEIRTPIGIILGYTDLALESPNLDEETRGYLHAARKNGEALKNLIGDLLDLAKIESDKVELESIEVNIQTLIDDVTSSMQIKAREKGIEIKVHVDPSTPQKIMTDPTSVRQVLTNLLSNAVKFTSDGCVSMSVSAKSEGRRNQRIQIRIADTGIGVPKAVVRRLFRPFSQADSSMRRNSSGTGLGLMISRKLARLLGGNVELAETMVDKGSVFEFNFVGQIPVAKPVDVAVAAAASAEIFDDCELEGYKILIVEDSEDNRELLSLYLTRAGAEVQTAENGKHGVHQALDSQPDAVLMDIQMPDMDGYEANRKLREFSFNKPIIALTANALKSERDRALNEGFTSYLTKPVDRQKLLSTLSQLIRAEQLH